MSRRDSALSCREERTFSFEQRILKHAAWRMSSPAFRASSPRRTGWLQCAHFPLYVMAGTVRRQLAQVSRRWKLRLLSSCSVVWRISARLTEHAKARQESQSASSVASISKRRTVSAVVIVNLCSWRGYAARNRASNRGYTPLYACFPQSLAYQVRCPRHAVTPLGHLIEATESARSNSGHVLSEGRRSAL